MFIPSKSWSFYGSGFLLPKIALVASSIDRISSHILPSDSTYYRRVFSCTGIGMCVSSHHVFIGTQNPSLARPVFWLEAAFMQPLPNPIGRQLQQLFVRFKLSTLVFSIGTPMTGRITGIHYPRFVPWHNRLCDLTVPPTLLLTVYVAY